MLSTHCPRASNRSLVAVKPSVYGSFGMTDVYPSFLHSDNLTIQPSTQVVSISIELAIDLLSVQYLTVGCVMRSGPSTYMNTLRCLMTTNVVCMNILQGECEGSGIRSMMHYKMTSMGPNEVRRSIQQRS